MRILAFVGKNPLEIYLDHRGSANLISNPSRDQYKFKISWLAPPVTFVQIMSSLPFPVFLGKVGVKILGIKKEKKTMKEP